MTDVRTGATNFPEASVYSRYAVAARSREQALCCPVEYAADFLSVILDEILAKDYGCGDPTPYAREGETSDEIHLNWWRSGATNRSVSPTRGA